MAHISKDRIKETTTSTSTGNITLAGAVTGFKSFSSVMATSDTCYYTIVDNSAAAWEVGLGTLSAATTLVRTTVYASSNSNNLVNFGAGTKEVFLTLPSDRTVILSGTSLNIPSGHTYRINGTDVLSATTLGSGVINSSLTSVGTLTSLSISGQLTSTYSAGAPFSVSSTTVVTNLNADLLDGQNGT
jgi:hypothetical protein